MAWMSLHASLNHFCRFELLLSCNSCHTPDATHESHNLVLQAQQPPCSGRQTPDCNTFGHQHIVEPQHHQAGVAYSLHALALLRNGLRGTSATGNFRVGLCWVALAGWLGAQLTLQHRRQRPVQGQLASLTCHKPVRGPQIPMQPCLSGPQPCITQLASLGTSTHCLAPSSRTQRTQPPWQNTHDPLVPSAQHSWLAPWHLIHELTWSDMYTNCLTRPMALTY
jgi:hypothetical protein